MVEASAPSAIERAEENTFHVIHRIALMHNELLCDRHFEVRCFRDRCFSVVWLTVLFLDANVLLSAGDLVSPRRKQSSLDLRDLTDSNDPVAMPRPSWSSDDPDARQVIIPETRIKNCYRN